MPGNRAPTSDARHPAFAIRHPAPAPNARHRHSLTLASRAEPSDGHPAPRSPAPAPLRALAWPGLASTPAPRSSSGSRPEHQLPAPGRVPDPGAQPPGPVLRLGASPRPGSRPRRPTPSLLPDPDAPPSLLPDPGAPPSLLPDFDANSRHRLPALWPPASAQAPAPSPNVPPGLGSQSQHQPWLPASAPPPCLGRANSSDRNLTRHRFQRPSPTNIVRWSSPTWARVTSAAVSGS
ncbi:mucin-7 [Amycolatopsis saalfeldensis]|uniref:Mucin-7 n=1 Tax=Amycolatopsis saalfeldensis TaxID=394193 RepID=A0A1H8YDG6_9PSEU|nr:mucin-7 [Amycolatopsis saalfeldensis]